jgi:hypothetical protein
MIVREESREADKWVQGRREREMRGPGRWRLICRTSDRNATDARVQCGVRGCHVGPSGGERERGSRALRSGLIWHFKFENEDRCCCELNSLQNVAS